MNIRKGNRTIEAPGEDKQTFSLLVMFDTDEDGWEVVSCPTLPGCHSQGRTREEALANIKEAIELYLEYMLEHGEPLPSSTRFEVILDSGFPLSRE